MTTEVTPEAQEQLRAAVDTALASPQQAQGFLSSIPDLSKVGEMKTTVLEVVDKVLAAIDTIQNYSWLIPSKYVGAVQGFEDALKKVRGWLD